MTQTDSVASLKPLYKGAVLFDLDGTLVDTAADFVAIVNRLRAQDDLPSLPDATIRSRVSDGARALTTLGFGLKEGEPDFAEKLDALLNEYADTLGDDAQLFDGFAPLLESLQEKQLAWGIVTNKPARFTDPLLTKLDLAPSNGVAICPCHVSARKPDPEGLIKAMGMLDLSVEQCIYVGDHERDIEAAKNAGMKSIACAYGYLKDDDNIHDWQADHIVHTVSELHDLIDQLFDDIHV